MATAQQRYSRAWCLWIKSTPAIYAATTDLPEAAAVAALDNHFFTRRIVNLDARLITALPNLFYGTPEAAAVTFELDNSDAAFNTATDYRLTPVVLYHYDRDTAVRTTELVGCITQAVFPNGRAVLTIGTYNGAMLDEMLPAAVLDPAPGSPAATSDAPGAPLPMVFGENVPVVPPSIAFTPASDPPGYDFVVSYGTVYVRNVYQDYDSETPGLERLGSFVEAPGSPVRVSSTKFSVTGDQRVRYIYETGQGGMPIRFKTTAGGSAYFYSHVKAYDATVSPHQVEIADALLGAGLNAVAIGGDYFVLTGTAYQDVTDGLLPVPAAPGADLTCVRTFDPGESSLLVIADNPAFPTSIPASPTHISEVIQEIVTNAIWGLSVRTAQAVNATNFAVAAVALNTSGMGNAINGALGYDQQQRRAGNVLDELLMMRGIRLWQNDALEWCLTVDMLPPASAKTFQLGSGYQYGIPIKRVLDHGRIDLAQATRTLILHWSVLGRGGAPSAKFTSREYARRSTKAVSGVGTDLHIYNQWIRDQAIAELVCHYLAEKLKGADERLQFVAGQEARDVTLGEVIDVLVPADGVTGQWQVAAIDKGLDSVTLSCIRANNTAYDAASGVTTSNEPDPEAIETRTATGSGTNLIRNPDFSGPYRAISDGTVFPTQWVLGTAAGDIHTTVDYSAAVLPDLLGGHYVRAIVEVDTAPTSFAALSTVAISAQQISCPGAVTLLASFYCDAVDGVCGAVVFSNGVTGTPTISKLVRDATDTNGPLGWTRYYWRAHSPVDTVKANFYIAFTKAATYQVEACQLEIVERTARRPSKWRRHMPQAISEKVLATITFNGSTIYTASDLIPAGCKVVGVNSVVSTAIVFGTATSYAIGTDADPQLWGAALTNTAAGTTSGVEDYETRNEIYFPTTTDVLVTGNGTITSGVLQLTVEYSRPAPPSRA